MKFPKAWIIWRGVCLQAIHDSWKWWENKLQVQLFKYKELLSNWMKMRTEIKPQRKGAGSWVVWIGWHHVWGIPRASPLKPSSSLRKSADFLRPQRRRLGLMLQICSGECSEDHGHGKHGHGQNGVPLVWKRSSISGGAFSVKKHSFLILPDSRNIRYIYRKGKNYYNYYDNLLLKITWLPAKLWRSRMGSRIRFGLPRPDRPLLGATSVLCTFSGDESTNNSPWQKYLASVIRVGKGRKDGVVDSHCWHGRPRLTGLKRVEWRLMFSCLISWLISIFKLNMF